VRKRAQILFVIAVMLASAHRTPAQWFSSPGPEGGSVTSFAASAGFLFAGTAAGVSRSTDSGATWAAVNEGLTSRSVWALAVCDEYLFAGTYDGGVFRSGDNGGSWSSVNDDLTDTHVLALSAHGDLLVAGTLGGVFLTTTGGTTWRAAGPGMTDLHVRVLAFRENALFAGTLGGGIFVSGDRGASWAPGNAALAATSVLSLAFLGSRIFVGTYSGLFLSPDDGGSWKLIDPAGTQPSAVHADAGMEVQAPKTIYALAVRGADVFLGMHGDGVFHTTDGGETWDPFNSGLTNFYINSIFVHEANLFIGFYGGGTARTPIPRSVTSVADASPGFQGAAMLEQNSPNPFNGQTRIGFRVPASGEVTLTVFDLLGHEVATLINRQMAAGEHTTTFDSGRLASGIYLCRLTAGASVWTRKMLLVR
jgi:photosystem II stability/assembly factor-like uncharacterized protein